MPSTADWHSATGHSIVCTVGVVIAIAQLRRRRQNLETRKDCPRRDRLPMKQGIRVIEQRDSQRNPGARPPRTAVSDTRRYAARLT
jgi:hypothetical protein